MKRFLFLLSKFLKDIRIVSRKEIHNEKTGKIP